MATLMLPGLTTGIDTAALVEQLMIVNSRRLALYQLKKLDYEGKNDALDELRSKVSALRNATSTLSNADNLELFNTSSSDSDILTLSASAEANPGSHTIEIEQLATAETWIHDNSGFTYATDYVGGGNFIYSYNYQERIITAIEDETTLEDLVNLINEDAENPGVTASLLYQDGKYHLMLNGRETGADYQISINQSNTQVLAAFGKLTTDESGTAAGDSTKITELYGFSGELGDDDLITITGKQHDGTAVNENFAVTEYTTVDHLISEINDAFVGTATATFVNGQIRLTDHTYGTSQMELDIAFTSSTATLSLPEFTKVQAADLSYTVSEGTEAQLTDKIVDLDQFSDGPPGGSDKIIISGTDKSGTPITPSELAVDSNTTLQNLIDQINTAFSGIATASLVDGKIRLTDDESGASSTSISLEYSGTATLQVPTAFTKISQGTDGGTVDADITSLNPTDFIETQSAQNSKIKVDGYPTGAGDWIERNSNSITDVLLGVTLQLHDVTAVSESVEITLSRNTSAVGAKVKSMVAVYNDLLSFLTENTEYDAETKQMGILSRDVAVSFIKSQVRNPFIGITPGFADQIDTFIQAADIGITFDGHGVMEFEQSEFDDAIEEDFSSVLELLGAIGSGNSDSDSISFYSASTYTTAGEYDVRVGCDSEGSITSAWIKLASESWSQARRATISSGNVINGSKDFGSDDPEKGLQLTFEWDGTTHTYDNGDPDSGNPVEATIWVKQGFAGALEDALDRMLEADGSLDISEELVDGNIEQINRRIEREEARLDQVQERLVARFARMEKTLTLLQQQFAAVALFDITGDA